VALPIPLVAPVIRATVPVRSVLMVTALLVFLKCAL
jgi:hypothetical protein